MNNVATPSADSSLPSVAPTLTGAYNMAYLVRATPSPKSPSATSDILKTLGETVALKYGKIFRRKI